MQVLSEHSYEDLYSYCSQFGNIINSYYYAANGKNATNTNYILLEFEHAASATEALLSGTLLESDSSELGVPVKSRFMWLASNKNRKKLQPKSKPIKLITNQVATEVDKVYLYKCLQMADSVSAQMQILYSETCLNELAVRIRFMAALQIEEIFSGIYLDTRVYPFGSSVNGFGKLGSDLDLILKPLKDERKQSHQHSNNRLFFHEKEAVSRNAKQSEISALAQILTVFAPGIEKVVPIPKARIPIVKYYHSLLSLQVDLSLANM